MIEAKPCILDKVECAFRCGEPFRIYMIRESLKVFHIYVEHPTHKFSDLRLETLPIRKPVAVNITSYKYLDYTGKSGKSPIYYMDEDETKIINLFRDIFGLDKEGFGGHGCASFDEGIQRIVIFTIDNNQYSDMGFNVIYNDVNWGEGIKQKVLPIISNRIVCRRVNCRTKYKIFENYENEIIIRHPFPECWQYKERHTTTIKPSMTNRRLIDYKTISFIEKTKDNRRIKTSHINNYKNPSMFRKMGRRILGFDKGDIKTPDGEVVNEYEYIRIKLEGRRGRWKRTQCKGLNLATGETELIKSGDIHVFYYEKTM